MIQDNMHSNNSHHQIYPIQSYSDGQGTVEGLFDRNIICTSQLPNDENNSLYSIDNGSFANSEDLHVINSSDLIKIPEGENLLDDLLENDVLTTNPQIMSNGFPNLEEFIGDFEFGLNLNPSSTGKTHWYYSPKMQKIFIRLDQTFYIEVEFSSKIMQHGNLYLRAMMVFIDDISSPVQRCHNHMNSDHSSDTKLKNYILRSENSGTMYTGINDGRDFKDRLSVLIPLSLNIPQENNMIKQSIALKFVCQNSCIGRKQTAIIFTLENQHFYILGKRVVNVKVCSCPKRDKIKDEEKYYKTRRPSFDQNDCPPNKIPSILKIKEEPVASASPQLNFPVEDTTRDEFTETTLMINVPKHLAHDIYHSVFNIISGQMAWDTKNSDKYTKYLREAKKKLEELHCSRKQSSPTCSRNRYGKL